jgi:DNA-binding transcriptional ArsR family regulator
MQTPLSPTLWRTCRVLANASRLRVLKTVLDHGPACVGAIARAGGISEVSATQQLRLLQARGLLATVRQSRWVYYSAGADPAVEHAAPLLAALRQAFARGMEAPDLLFALTAFTHPRRIALARILAAGPASVEEMSVRGGLSRVACYRHMDKLERRGFVKLGDGNRFQLVSPDSVFAAALLREALGSGARR